MAASPSAPAPRPAVLIVDDEPGLLEAMRQGLAAEFDIDVAGTAEEATLLAGTRSYDAIVCDQLLPGEQGLEFLMRLSKQQPAARRILLTGYINPDLISRSVALAGLSSCLLKPVSTAELAKVIRRALAG
ncbi:MAG TPA: response regulator [Opitutaceae bacterium]|nr:response regulator [Opitutaceae bacterium]